MVVGGVDVVGVLVGVVLLGGSGRIGDWDVVVDELVVAPVVVAGPDWDVLTAGVSPATGVPTMAVLHADSVIIAASPAASVARCVCLPDMM